MLRKSSLYLTSFQELRYVQLNKTLKYSFLQNLHGLHAQIYKPILLVAVILLLLYQIVFIKSIEAYGVAIKTSFVYLQFLPYRNGSSSKFVKLSFAWVCSLDLWAPHYFNLYKVFYNQTFAHRKRKLLYPLVILSKLISTPMWNRNTWPQYPS